MTRRLLALMALLSTLAFADGNGLILSMHAKADVAPSADPDSPFWKGTPGVFAKNDGFGKPTPGHTTEIRSRWTDKNIYFLFVCPYEQLNLKPDPSVTKETNVLWDWDVAEVFVGSDFKNTHRYKEFEISPRGEWVDLDIDRDHPLPEGGWLWNSGFHAKARIDEAHKIWYGEMQIPIESIDSRPPAPGNEMRINFYRTQGPGPKRKSIVWQATHAETYHVPEAFGRIRLMRAKP